MTAQEIFGNAFFAGADEGRSLLCEEAEALQFAETFLSLSGVQA